MHRPDGPLERLSGHIRLNLRRFRQLQAETLFPGWQLQPKRLDCGCRRVSDLTKRNATSKREFLNMIKTYELHMLRAVGKDKRVCVSESPVPKWLTTSFNIFSRRPRAQIIKIAVDEIRFNILRPTGQDIMTKDVSLRAAPLPCFVGLGAG